MSSKKSLLKKRRRRSIIAFEMIRLDRTSTEPLHQQLYRQIRDELRSGSFSDGASRLPSSRALAADLGISRLTVNLAFSKLHAEGYLRSKAKSGTFVAYPLPDSFLSADKFARPAQRTGRLLVRFQSSALSSGPDRDCRRNAASHVDYRNRIAESGRARVD